MMTMAVVREARAVVNVSEDVVTRAVVGSLAVATALPVGRVVAAVGDAVICTVAVVMLCDGGCELFERGYGCGC